MSEDVIKSFNAVRNISKPSHLCYAAHLSLNFDQSGNISACCFNRSHVLGRYPDNSISEIWSGKAIQQLRNVLKNNDLSLGCQSCSAMLQEGNFENVLIRHFDEYLGFQDQSIFKKNILNKILGTKLSESGIKPVTFEFEISNHCNLECIMCGGKWSSAIRKNREQLPPLKSPYDAAFVEQVKDFLPGLRRANFLGGEPFLIGLYYDIWEAIVDINPAIVVAMTSNGTMLSNRAKKIIDGLEQCKVTLSIDSLQKDTWESIRRNGDFTVLKSNIDYLQKNGKLVSFSVCPMIQNWKEIPDLVKYCADHNLDIYFNIVYEPLGGRKIGIHQNAEQFQTYPNSKTPASSLKTLLPEVSLGQLSKEKLKKVINYYSGFKFNGRYQVQMQNFIVQLENWLAQKEEKIRVES